MNLNLSRQTGHIKLTELALWQPTFPQLCREFYAPKINANKLNAGYFLRCAGTRRGNSTVSDTASLLMLDGDSRLVDGEIVAGAENPQYVHMMLNHLNIDHFMYTSHSNAPDLWKYRVLMPVEYRRQQLPALLDWIFTQFNNNGIHLVNVKENAAWAQAWFMPCVPAERAHLFKTWWRVGGKVSNPRAITNSLEPVEPFDVVRICADYENKQSIANESITTLQNVARPMPTNAQNPIDAFNAAFTAHDVLIRNGYKQIGKRYLHPNSSSKVAGVRILENGRVYSDSSDVLNDGKAHDCWDVYRLLECGGDMRQALNWNKDLTKENQRAFYA